MRCRRRRSFFGIVGYVGLNQISIELECPFGTDPNDLPLLEFQRCSGRRGRDWRKPRDRPERTVSLRLPLFP